MATYYFISSCHLEYKINMNAMQDKLKNWQNSKLVRFLFLFGLDDKAPVDDEKVCYVLGNWLFWHPVVHNKTFINESRLDSL